jgi:DNA repair exonuclease SbcCD nuclease subunit
MKVLFTADLHIRIGQKNIPRPWAIKQYEIMFNEIDRVFKEQDCELEVHGGDIFDKVPTMEELSVYIGYLWRDAKRSRLIYDGNHEATKKGDTFLKYIQPMIPELCALASGAYEGNWWNSVFDRAGMDVLPYTDLHKLKSIKAKHPILFTHVRGEIPPHVKPEVNLSLFEKWEIVFAGDLHAHSNSQRNIVYPGSPRTVTFHRNEVKLGVIVFDTEDVQNWEWHEIKVPQLIRKTINDPNDMVKTDFHHTIYELTGNVLDLAKIDKDSDLLDKKIIYNEQPASLDLADMTIEEELEQYLGQITRLSKPEIEDVMEVFHANT